jgi:hypothetical protein
VILFSSPQLVKGLADGSGDFQGVGELLCLGSITEWYIET